MEKLIIPCPQCSAKNSIPVFKQHLQAKCGRCATLLDASAIIRPIEIMDSRFASFIKDAPLPVLVDFYSPTCGPCRMLKPVVDEMARLFYKKMLVAKVDTSRNPHTAMQYQIRGVPALLFFRASTLVDQVLGALPAPQLKAKIEAFLDN